MRLAFLGTPDFSVACLAELVAAGHEIACVYSQPPAPRGRGQDLKPSPVHAFAESLGLPVRTPVSMKTPEEIAAFQALDLDAAVVVAFGQILVKAVLEAPRLGCFNLHASLLPRWRGAAPIQRAIMAGDAVTGVQVMRMSEGLDEGPVLMGEQVRIDALETAGSLHDKLAAVGSRMLPVALAAIERGAAREVPQAEEGVTYAKKIKSAEARIDWTRPAAEVDRHIRGLSPFPGAWFEAPSDKGPVRVKALLSRVEDADGSPGAVLDDALLIACGEVAVRLLKAQREGKGVQEAEVFLRGFPLAAGTVLA
ncbi:methionyl-tRNA formyltransferase [Caulobacter sp. UNC358MFTsu5.1]|uniref:methionyl-tRNA formyltransferase n=1 Tax=Caulobacter sp. UNC358MFTsu5.1 TaxID=1449049 RepID=UPI0004A6FE25|nr:methionyl-tRNA formyltransferase [Caulobacter sp. UNC358MFTsu5.1]